MKTFYEIVENKTYRQLTAIEKEELQNRQSHLVIAWQDETNELKKEEIFDELFDSLKGLIKGMAYKRAEISFSLEQEDIEGIMYLVLVEQLIKYDRTLDKPFQPIFINWVNLRMHETYRAKGYDVHETTYHEANRLDNPSPQDNTVTMLDALNLKVDTDFASDIDTNIVTDEVLTEMFGQDDKKKTIVHMFLQDFKRNEIVSAVAESGKSTDAIAKQVNRTVKQFKEHYLNLLQSN